MHKSKGNGTSYSRPLSPNRFASDLTLDQRRMDELVTLRAKATVVSDITSSGGVPFVSTRKIQPYPVKSDFVPAQFVLPEKVLSGPVSTTPRIRASNSSATTGSTFQGKPVLIGNLNEISMTSAKQSPKTTVQSPDLSTVVSSQAYSYAMSVTGMCLFLPP